MMKIVDLMKWLKVISMAPLALLVLSAAHFWEWFHFGPSSQILQVTRQAKQRLFQWRTDIEKRQY
jgi:hypothetical protein